MPRRARRPPPRPAPLYLWSDEVPQEADAALGAANITVNKNTVPNDPQSPFVTSGIRIGTPAITTRGFNEQDCRELAGWIADVLDDVNNQQTIESVKAKVLEICSRLPVYGLEEEA